MAATPRLSICVPSRNRQYYFQKTIEGLCRNPRQDVQFVVADNSTDPSIMNEYMKGVTDPRVVYLPSEDRTLSMMDNWERTVAASTGDWVTVIGDDDHCEADVIDVINKAQSQLPDLEALTWGIFSYNWPDGEQTRRMMHVPLNTMVIEVMPEASYHRMFRWVDARAVPVSGFSLYHSGIRRELLERIKKRYGGRYFEYPTVDYDIAMKVILNARRFVVCQRPFSVMGVCPESNSYAVARPKDTEKKLAIFIEETGRDIHDDEEVRDFPFGAIHGLSSVICMAQRWFCKKYNVEVKNWEANFAKACAFNTENYGEFEDFEQSRLAYEKAFRGWKGGKFLKFYKPEFKPADHRVAPTGFSEETAYVDCAIANIETPAELFDFVNAITVPPALLEFDLKNAKYKDGVPKSAMG